PDSDSVSPGSNPGSPATLSAKTVVSQRFKPAFIGLIRGFPAGLATSLATGGVRAGESWLKSPHLCALQRPHLVFFDARFLADLLLGLASTEICFKHRQEFGAALGTAPHRGRRCFLCVCA